MRRRPLKASDLPPHLAAMIKPKAHKYSAQKVEIDGKKFDSKAEYKHYCELKIRARAGEISDLKMHTRYPIFLNGRKICDVDDDFSYLENGQRVAVDVKGKLNRESRIKHKLVTAAYPDLEWRIIKTSR